MNSTAPIDVSAQVEDIYRSESRRVFATLIRLLGDFDLAEEALHEAFAAAVERWPQEGVPKNPRAWLVSAGRFKGIDVIRRRARRDGALAHLAERLAAENQSAGVEYDDENIPDDRLRLIFTCCHPALAPEAQVALTLREVCGLTTEEIAGAFLTSPATLAQRIVRAKAKIKQAGIPFQVPSRAELPDRLSTLLHVTDDDVPTALDELVRVVRPGSPVAIGLWGGRDHAGLNEDDPPRWFRIRTDDQVRAMVAGHGTIEQFEVWQPEGDTFTYQWVVLRTPT